MHSPSSSPSFTCDDIVHALPKRASISLMTFENQKARKILTYIIHSYLASFPS
jgi:hypothetical protein